MVVTSAVLADIRAYTGAWQLPIVAAFLLIWLVGGYYLLRRRIVKAGILSRTKVSMQAVKINFLGIFVGLGGCGVISFLAYALYKREVIGLYQMGALAAILGIPTLVLLNWVVSMVLLKDVPAGQVLRLTAVNALAVCVLLAACAVGAGVPANRMRLIAKALDDCRSQMAITYDALQSYKRSHPDQTVTIADLVSKNLMDVAKARCPAGPQDGSEYVYAPAGGKDNDEDRILLCDPRSFHDGSRMVLLDNAPRNQLPRPKALSEQDFQKLLAKPVNADLAARLKK